MEFWYHLKTKRHLFWIYFEASYFCLVQLYVFLCSQWCRNWLLLHLSCTRVINWKTTYLVLLFVFLDNKLPGSSFSNLFLLLQKVTLYVFQWRLNMHKKGTWVSCFLFVSQDRSTNSQSNRQKQPHWILYQNMGQTTQWFPTKVLNF